MSSLVSVVKRRDLAWGVAVIMLLTTIWVAYGNDVRAGVSPPPGEGIGVVYVAVGTNFPDSLGAAAGAGAQGAPVIIVPTNPPIPGAIAAELQRLDPKRLVIVGGTAVISVAMESALASLLPNAPIQRLAGQNRYETNALFSESVFPVEGWVSVPAAAFGAPDPDVDDVQNFGSLAWNSPGGELLGGIQLPHGAEIVEFKARLRDNSTTGSVKATLFRVRTGAGTLGADEIASVATPVSPSVGLNDFSTENILGFAVVDNENHSYYVHVVGADNTSLRAFLSVMVRYRVGS